jgi:2-amino-4-hydroxy-6-hydroxymethyldihydropteridine diphosphokinase
VRYYLGLGGNLGDVAASMAAAVDALRARGADVPLVSSCYATTPMGDQAGDQYLNAALGIDSARRPVEMLRICQEIENLCGRVRSLRWGPRTLDIDILLAGDEVLSTDDLTLPHSGLTYRRFALDPLCAIAPDLRHPGLGVTISEIRSWLLPRPLDITIRAATGTDLETLTATWPGAIRSKVRIRVTSEPAVASSSGWLLDCVDPVSATTPRSVSLAHQGHPLEQIGALLAAMTDDPLIVPSTALDRVR